MVEEKRTETDEEDISLHVIVRARTPPRIPAFVFVSSKFKHSERKDVARLVTAHKPFTRTYATAHSHHALVLLEHEGGVTEPSSLSALTAMQQSYKAVLIKYRLRLSSKEPRPKKYIATAINYFPARLKGLSSVLDPFASGNFMENREHQR